MNMRLINMEQRCGVCPKCGNAYLTYGDGAIAFHRVLYPVKCNDCGFDGSEIHPFKFLKFVDANGVDLKPTPEPKREQFEGYTPYCDFCGERKGTCCHTNPTMNE